MIIGLIGCLREQWPNKKIAIVKSRDGWGIDKTLKGLSTLQSHVETNIGTAGTPLNNLVGKR